MKRALRGNRTQHQLISSHFWATAIAIALSNQYILPNLATHVRLWHGYSSSALTEWFLMKSLASYLGFKMEYNNSWSKISSLLRLSRNPLPIRFKIGELNVQELLKEFVHLDNNNPKIIQIHFSNVLLSENIWKML